MSNPLAIFVDEDDVRESAEHTLALWADNPITEDEGQRLRDGIDALNAVLNDVMGGNDTLLEFARDYMHMLLIGKVE